MPFPLSFPLLVEDVTPGAAVSAPVWRDQALDPVTGDLLQVDGDQVWVKDADGLASDLLSRLNTILGECFIDTSIGVPWFERAGAEGQEILGQKPRPNRVAEIIRRETLATPGISDCIDLVVTAAGRELAIDFTAVGSAGELIRVTNAQALQGA